MVFCFGLIVYRSYFRYLFYKKWENFKSHWNLVLIMINLETFIKFLLHAWHCAKPWDTRMRKIACALVECLVQRGLLRLGGIGTQGSWGATPAQLSVGGSEASQHPRHPGWGPVPCVPLTALEKIPKTPKAKARSHLSFPLSAQSSSKTRWAPP